MNPRVACNLTDRKRAAGLALALATGLYVAVRLALLAWAAWRVRFVMDEMCFLTQFRYVEAGLYDGFDPVKTVLGLVTFNSPRAFTGDSASLLLSARMIGLGIALATVALVATAARHLSNSWSATAAGVVAILSFTNFAERAFRIRADSLSTLFAVAGLAVAVAPGQSIVRAWLVGGLTGAAFLSTQKAIYVALAFGLAYLAAFSAEVDWRTAILQASRYAAGWCLAILGYAIYFGGVGVARVLRQVFLSPLDVALNAPNAYGGLLYYVKLSSRQNALLYLLGIAALTCGLLYWRRSSVVERWAIVAAAVLTAVVLRHNQPWPYVLALPQVFLAVAIAQGFHLLARRNRVGERVGVGLLAVAALISLPRGLSYPWKHTNQQQLEAVRWAEGFLEPKDRYFDGVGMVPTRGLAGSATEWWWDRPTILRLRLEFGRGDVHVVDRILEDNPKLWILNYRLAEVWNRIGPMTEGSYVRIAPLFYVAGTELPAAASEVPYRCRWSGKYRLFSVDGRPLDEEFSVGDAPAARSATIQSGDHLVRRAAPGSPALLLPEGTRFQGPLPGRSDPVPNLFAGVYEF